MVRCGTALASFSSSPTTLEDDGEEEVESTATAAAAAGVGGGAEAEAAGGVGEAAAGGAALLVLAGTVAGGGDGATAAAAGTEGAGAVAHFDKCVSLWVPAAPVLTLGVGFGPDPAAAAPLSVTMLGDLVVAAAAVAAATPPRRTGGALNLFLAVKSERPCAQFRIGYVLGRMPSAER